LKQTPNQTFATIILSSSTVSSETSSSKTPTGASSIRRERRQQVPRSSGGNSGEGYHGGVGDLDSLQQEGHPGESNDEEGGGVGGSHERRRPDGVSRRTAQAILYALEEAIRTPHPFTPDLIEERASMSALMATSQSSRAPGAAGTTSNNIPVPDYPIAAGFNQYTNPSYYEQTQNTQRTPQRSSQQQPVTPQQQTGSQDTRRTSKPPAGAANMGSADVRSQPGPSRRSQTDNADQGNQGNTAGNGIGAGAGSSGTNAPGRSGTQRGPDPSGGSRGGAASPSDSRQRRPSESTRNPRLLTAPGHQPTSTVSAATATSPFPHAFERWEMLSSQWEGLTRYWIRRLEQHQEEISRDPLGVQMSRNITDLSAAGANLFHAVVELQRLRASSERKFQRWFFETRADQERSREMTSELESTLRNERQKRADAMATIARLEKEKTNADKLVEEVRRELQISREEARRAWEELGRREQEERERTNSLRGGHPTLVGGVQVLPMPMPGVPNRSGTTGSRPRPSSSGVPQSSGSQQQYEQPIVSAAVQPVTQPTGPLSDVNHPMSPQYSIDAMTDDTQYIGRGEQGYHAPTLHHEPNLPQVPSPPSTTQIREQAQAQASTSSYTSEHSQTGHTQAAQPQQHPSSQRTQPASAGVSSAGFYQHNQPPTLHPPPERTFSPGEESFVSEPGRRPSSQVSVSISAPSDDGENDDDWEHDAHGNILRNAQGLPVRRQYQGQTPQMYQSQPVRQPQQPQPGQYYDPRQQTQLYTQMPPQNHPGQQQEYQYPPQQQQQQQQQHQQQQYQQQPPQLTPQQQQQYAQYLQQQGHPVDQASVAAGGWGPGWEVLGPRYDHPTRLSEIIEVDERTHTSVSGDDDRGLGHRR